MGTVRVEIFASDVTQYQSELSITADQIANATLVGKNMLIAEDNKAQRQLLDHYDSVADLMASTKSPKGVGEIWRAEQFEYVEVVDDAHADLTTAGGVKLQVVPGENGVDIRAFGAISNTTYQDWIHRKNLLIWTDNFESGWSASRGAVLTVDATTGPGGVGTASKLENSTANNDARLIRNIGGDASDKDYKIFSVYLKNIDATRTRIYINGTDESGSLKQYSFFANWNGSTLTDVSVAQLLSDDDIDFSGPDSEGFYRVWLRTPDKVSTEPFRQARIFPNNLNENGSIYVANIQLENTTINGSVTSYQKIEGETTLRKEHDSTTAISKAIDSKYPVYGPPGNWYVTAEKSITTRKSINLAGRGGRYGVSNQVTFTADGQFCRIFTDQNINIFSVEQSQVYIYGGAFDVSLCDAYTKACIYYPMGTDEVWFRSWGGGIRSFFIGNTDTLSNPGNGGRAVFFDFQNGTDENAYITHADFDIEAVGFAVAFEANERKEGLSQWANNNYVTIDCDWCKQCLIEKAWGSSFLTTRHQARNVMDVSEKDLPSVDLGSSGGNICEFYTVDTNSSPNEEGHYRTSVDFAGNGVDNRFIPRTRSTFNDIINRIIEMPRNGRAESFLGGFIPNIRTPSFGQNASAISHLDNQLTGLDLRDGASYHFKSFVGTEVSDFSTLTDDSVTAGITESTDVTLKEEQNLFRPNLSDTFFYPSMVYNSTAITNNDYVELYIQLPYNHRMNDLVLTMYYRQRDAHSKQIQVIEKGAGGGVNSNKIHNVAFNTNAWSTNRTFRFELTGNTGGKFLIIRWIGCTHEDRGMPIIDLCLLAGRDNPYLPYIHTCGGQTILGDLTINGNLNAKSTTQAPLPTRLNRTITSSEILSSNTTPIELVAPNDHYHIVGAYIKNISGNVDYSTNTNLELKVGNNIIDTINLADLPTQFRRLDVSRSYEHNQGGSNNIELQTADGDPTTGNKEFTIILDYERIV